MTHNSIGLVTDERPERVTGRGESLARAGPALPAVRPRGDEVVVEGEDHRGGPVAQLQLGEQVVDMRLDRSLTDEQLGRDLGVRLAAADEREHLAFAAG